MRGLLKECLKHLNSLDVHNDLTKRIEAELAKPEPEPVAFISGGIGGGTAVGWFEKDIINLPIGTKLYTNPPAQQKPLSDDEISNIIREVSNGSVIRRDGKTSHLIARAIEQAHGIK